MLLWSHCLEHWYWCIILCWNIFTFVYLFAVLGTLLTICANDLASDVLWTYTALTYYPLFMQREHSNEEALPCGQADIPQWTGKPSSRYYMTDAHWDFLENLFCFQKVMKPLMVVPLARGGKIIATVNSQVPLIVSGFMWQRKKMNWSASWAQHFINWGLTKPVRMQHSHGQRVTRGDSTPLSRTTCLHPSTISGANCVLPSAPKAAKALQAITTTFSRSGDGPTRTTWLWMLIVMTIP